MMYVIAFGLLVSWAVTVGSAVAQERFMTQVRARGTQIPDQPHGALVQLLEARHPRVATAIVLVAGIVLASWLAAGLYFLWVAIRGSMS